MPITTSPRRMPRAAAPRPRVAAALALGAALALTAAARADRELKEFEPVKGLTLRYTLITPVHYDGKTPAPTMLLFPPGPQNFQMMSAAVSLFDEVTMKDSPWVIICPEAPKDTVFFRGSEKHIPALIAEVQKFCTIEGNKVHAVGISNGGISSFRFGVEHADRTASITTLPGYPLPEDKKLLVNLKAIPVRMHVGTEDALPWIDTAKATEAELKRLDGDVRLKLWPTEGHMITSMSGAALLRDLEPLRRKEGTLTPDHAAVLATLDDLHGAAAKADLEKYFALFAPEGVFIGTDATERWNVDQFRAYTEPLFKKGKGWVYKPRPESRHVDLAPGGQIAWFDELLDSAKYGLCRGTGVLRKIDGAWKISQYHLTLPVPNEIMDRIAVMVKGKTPKVKPEPKAPKP
ncbi:hypothetical protein BH11PLA1_BH11PLA1_00450 [soil metagenome]